MTTKSNINLNSNNEEILLERYVSEISAYQPLSDDEERRLSLLISQGDDEAKDRLVKANLKFVVSIARQYATEGVSMLDLIDEGNIALIAAASRYDGSRGRRFAQYAVWQIRKAMEAFLPDNRLLMNRTISEHLPGSPEPSAETQADLEALEQKLPRLPERERTVIAEYYGIGQAAMTMSEIGEKHNLKRERVRQIRNRALRRLATL